MSPDILLPAAGQGALAIQCRADDRRLQDLLAPLHCQETQDCVSAERAFLAALDGSCRTPIAALADIKHDRLILAGRLLSDDGKKMVAGQIDGARDEALSLGRELAARLHQNMKEES